MQKLSAALLGEALGTFLLVLFGTGSVACAVLTGALQGLWQVAVVWGFGVTIAIYCSAALSGAHLNPAVSLAFAVLRPRGFPLARLLPYWGAQLGGRRRGRAGRLGGLRAVPRIASSSRRGWSGAPPAASARR